jgi:hypothetical protein
MSIGERYVAHSNYIGMSNLVSRALCDIYNNAMYISRDG